MKKIILLLLLIISFPILNIFGQANQKNIIINEFSQGSGTSPTTDEWIELLVTADNTNIQGVYLDTDGGNDLGNNVTLQLSTSYPGFSNVAMGSIIVIYNSTRKDPNLPADDTVFTDGKLLIPSNNTTYLSTTVWETSQAASDAIGLFNPKSGSTVEGIMAIAWGGYNNFPTSNFTNGWGYAISANSMATTQGFYYSGGTTSGVSNPINWILEDDISSSPKSTNPSGGGNGSNQKNIIINEFSQGSGTSPTTDEWIELLVTADNTNIQGVYLDADGNNDLGNNVTLQLSTTYSGFSSVAMGSIIVIYNSTRKDPNLPADDTVFTDGKLLIPSNNTTYLSTTVWETSQAASDAIGLFNPKSGSTVEGIMAIAWGGYNNFPTSNFTNGWGYAISADSMKTSKGFYYSGGTTSGVTNAILWGTEDDSSSSPGTTNGGNNNLLPVELSTFSLSVINTGVKLSWRTETEVSNYGFDIERKSDNKEWTKLGFVQGNGNSNSPKDYTFIDVNATAGKYSYRLKQIDTDGKFEYSKTIEVDLDSPQQFELSQNYPNPFNPNTTIKFVIPESGIIKLVLYNILGEEVKTLVNGFTEAGVHTINFNAEELNSGIYFYKITTPQYSKTMKMILVK